MAEEETNGTPTNGETKVQRTKKKHKTATKKTSGSRDFFAVRVDSDTASKINKLAAKLQLQTGDKTIAGDAIKYAVDKALR